MLYYFAKPNNAMHDLTADIKILKKLYYTKFLFFMFFSLKIFVTFIKFLYETMYYI